MGTPRDAARPTGAGVFLVRNPLSGTAVIRADPSALIAERLPDATVHELAEGERLDDVVAAAMAGSDPPRVLGVAGGDGSVARMAHLARRYGLPLLVLPGGTFNHFARAIGLSDVETAIEAVQAGRLIEVSVVEAAVDDDEPVTVLNAVSLGAYPQFIAERSDRMQDVGKWLAGVAATWRTLRGAIPIVVAREGLKARVWSVFVSVGRNAPDQVATMQRQEIDDDLLDVRLHHARGSRLRAVASLAFGRRTTAVLRAVRLMPPRTDVERLLVRTLELRVRHDDGAPSVYVHDGELEEERPGAWTLRCQIFPHDLRVYAPPPAQA